MVKDWNLLKNIEIVNLLIGDSIIKDEFIIEYKLPYMTKSEIYEFGAKLGIDKPYLNDNKESRCKYMISILDSVVEDNKISVFFKELLDLSRFRGIKGIDYFMTAEAIYWDILNNLMIRMNDILFFDKCHIEYDFNTWQFSLVDTEEDIKIESKTIDQINKQYIKRLNNEIDSAIKLGDYESSITKSRTLLEEVMIHGIEGKNETIEAKGNIHKLYNKFKTLYNMHQSKDLSNTINNLLSGFEKIITSISNIRDGNSDSHGAGTKRISIEKHHAVLFANAAVTMAEFLLSVIELSQKNINNN